MARNQGKYYVRKVWRDGRCVSEYIGAGPVAEGLAELDAAERARRKLEREALRQEREAELAVDALLETAGQAIRAVARATLLANGYHPHKGQWRKRR